MRYLIFFLLFSTSAISQTKYQKDFLEIWDDFNQNYAYFEESGIDWKKVKEIYAPAADTASNDADFIILLEKVIGELHNGHISLNTNLSTSNRIIPSGADLFVKQKGNDYFIADLRNGFPAEKCGLKVGMRIVKFNGKPIDSQLQSFYPKAAKVIDSKMQDYALSMLFAGTHDVKREVTVIDNGTEKTYYPDDEEHKSKGLLEYEISAGNVGYIRINNSLGNFDLIAEFDAALDGMINTNGLILDLTETPGGGNTTIARAIMGRFIDKELPYQKHQIDEREFGTKRSWIEYVSPRKKHYKNKLIIMVGHWTGSMGEGIAIGFDAMQRAKIAGTKMAGLLGAVENFRTSETQIGYQIPTEKLFHIDGTPRENFVPEYLTENAQQTFEQAKILVR